MMDERAVEFRVGVLVLAGFVIAGILVLLFRDKPAIFSTSREIHISLASARGVTPGTPIRKRGILIGRVTRVDFDDEHERVLLTADIDSNIQIYRDEVCQLRVSLLGDAELEIVPRKQLGEGPETPAAVETAGSAI